MASNKRQTSGKPESPRLPLMGAYSNRGSSPDKDQRFVNMFPETRKVEQLENTKIFITKRPGVSFYKQIGTGEARGYTYFNGKFYYAIGNKMYEDNGSVVEKFTMTTSTGIVAITHANSSSLGDYIFICDGIDGWFIKTDGSVTTVSNTMLHDISLVNVGAGYGIAPTVTVSAPPSGTTATAVANVSAGVLTSIEITNAGSGYVTPPTVTIDSPVLTFNPTTTVNITNDTITITGHKYGTGTAVTYTHGGGTVIGGLTAATKYYTIKVDDNTIKLATTAANATASIAINLTSVGTGTAHTLTGDTTAIATATLSMFPTPHVPSLTFIDGYIVIAKGSDVYTCDLDNPAKWSSDSYLSAEMFPDKIRCLARQNNQVVVMGYNSIEFFYDAANASGSPLSRNDSTTIQMGVAAPYAIYQNEQFCAYISQSDSGGRAVWLIRGFQPQKVSDEYIERILDAETDMNDCRGYGLRVKGHMFYVINLPTLNRTLVYDTDEKLWHEWSSATPIGGGYTDGKFAFDFIADNGTGVPYLLHTSGGYACTLDVNSSQDMTSAEQVEPIRCLIRTNRFDMDTYNRKFMSSLKLVGDRADNPQLVTISWSNDDYQSWVDRELDLSDDFPALHQLGSFRRRAFKIFYDGNQPLRLESLEVVYQEGSY